MSWTLQHSTTTQSLSAWGLSNVTLTQQSLSPSILSAEVAGDMLATLPWAFQDKVTLRDPAGVIHFVGYAMPPTRTGDAASETVQVTFADAWWFLGRGVYTQQIWDAEASEAVTTAVTALFADIDPGVGWERRAIEAELISIVAACNVEFPGTMQIGDIEGAAFASEPIPQRQSGATYEQSIRAALQYVPDAIQQWDYTTTPPTIHFRARDEATVREYDVSTLDATPTITRDDERVVRGVRILYIVSTGTGTQTTVLDAAGETTGGGIVSAVVDLTGGSGNAPNVQPPTFSPAVYQDVVIESEAIDPDSAAWWFKYGDTGAETAAQITVHPDSFIQRQGGGSVGGKTRLWISGEIPVDEYNEHVTEAEVIGYLEITTARTAPDGLIWNTKERRWLRVDCTTTDLNGEEQFLIKPGSVTGGGGSGTGGFIPTAVPLGIAAYLLAAWSGTQWRGAIGITGSECDMTPQVGDVVNLTGGLAEWETMAAQIHAVNRSLDRGEVRITLGIAEHLSLDDFVQRLQALKVAPALDLNRQTTGDPVGENIPTIHPSMRGPTTSPRCTVTKAVELWKFATGSVEMEMDAEAGSMTHRNTDGTAEVTVTPDGTSVANPSLEERVDTTPQRIQLYADGNTTTIRAGSITLEDALGASIEITANGITLTKGDETTQLSLLQLLLSAAGKTMSITEDQVIGSDAGGSVVMDTADGFRHTVGSEEATLDKTGLAVTAGDDSAEVTAAGGLAVTDGVKTGTLKADEMQMVSGDDIAEVTAEGGFVVTDSVVTATMNSSELRLVGDGKTTTVTTIAGKAIERRPADVCEDGVTLSTHVLMSEPAAP